MSWLLEMKNITKTFGTVKAVDNISLRLNAGEVVSLCGENGSGKSTLMKVLCGIYPHGSYDGEIIFAGETLKPNHIRDTERKGIAIIHQELALVKHLSVLENIFLGAEISRYGLLDYETMTLRCQKLLAQVNLTISPDTRVGDLGLGQQQLVEIAKALNKQVRLLILDEPTASLTEQETAILLDIIRDLQAHGIACIYISHKLNEVKAISDTICVIRDGQHIGTRDASGMNEDDVITMMVGRELTALYPNEPHACGDEILRVEHLTACTRSTGTLSGSTISLFHCVAVKSSALPDWSAPGVPRPYSACLASGRDAGKGKCLLTVNRWLSTTASRLSPTVLPWSLRTVRKTGSCR